MRNASREHVTCIVREPNSGKLMNSFGNEINSRSDRTIRQMDGLAGGSPVKTFYLLCARRWAPTANKRCIRHEQSAIVAGTLREFTLFCPCFALSSRAHRFSSFAFIWFIAFARLWHYPVKSQQKERESVITTHSLPVYLIVTQERERERDANTYFGVFAKSSAHRAANDVAD